MLVILSTIEIFHKDYRRFYLYNDTNSNVISFLINKNGTPNGDRDDVLINKIILRGYGFCT